MVIVGIRNLFPENLHQIDHQITNHLHLSAASHEAATI